ncbi:hypothetical protein [Antrihabitans sp. YC2-6]|uniref:hypothetical protein n=1 Tax=Antrihabitans sp. YC2-6 TaxID=2799498 RepID=UPI0018F479DC|nr:hypothetical protein [Antrihabitans sp. YC2-6]MBJ8345452.1 hypothetical protein [Antrihabitans sp. YC2-6]
MLSILLSVLLVIAMTAAVRSHSRGRRVFSLDQFRPAAPFVGVLTDGPSDYPITR